MSELRAFEQHDNLKISGVAIKYGDVATLGFGTEQVRKGAFGSDVEGQDIILNLMHDRLRPLARSNGGGLSLRDEDDGLYFEAVLPKTLTVAQETFTLISENILRGASTEFQALEEERDEKGQRIITKAALSAISIVDRPAYGESVLSAEARQLPAPNTGLLLTIPFQQDLVQSMVGRSVINVGVNALDDSLKAIAGGQMGFSVLIGDYSNLVASSTAPGAVSIAKRSGGLEVTVPKMLDTQANRELQNFLNQKVSAAAFPGIAPIESKTEKFMGPDGLDWNRQTIEKGTLCEARIKFQTGAGSVKQRRRPRRPSGGRRRRFIL